MADRIADVARDPLRAFRIPDELWHAALAVARERGESLSAAIRRFLEDYVKRGKED